MGADVKKRVAARLKWLIGNKPIVGLSNVGGPSKSYLYRMLGGTVSPTIDTLDAVCRAYGSTLGEFFLPWAKERDALRQEQAAEMRMRLERLIGSDAGVDGVLAVLRSLTQGDENTSSKEK
jgi:hypothetical protein